MAESSGIDELDRVIIAALQRDGRASFTEIARRVSSTEATVRHRVRRLQRRGVLQIVAVVASLELGLRRVMIGMTIHNHPVRDVERRLHDLEEVDYVAVTTGRYDVVIMAACRDDEHLCTLVTETLRGMPGIASVDVVTMLRETKDAYAYLPSTGTP